MAELSLQASASPCLLPTNAGPDLAPVGECLSFALRCGIEEAGIPGISSSVLRRSTTVCDAMRGIVLVEN